MSDSSATSQRTSSPLLALDCALFRSSEDSISSRKENRCSKVKSLFYTLIVYFLTKGEAAFVLPQCDDMPFLTVEQGDVFGIIDMVPEHKQSIVEKEVTRSFSVMALDASEALCLSLEVRKACDYVVGLSGCSKGIPIDGK